ncbi:hypothetical protein J1614_011444 [Plenodomus biglobosus]|nr:hypothetical protein J1614_011444 [Plenodomus biglobosus]
MVDLGKKRLTSQAGRQTTPSPSPSPSDTPSANMPRVEDGAQKPSPSPCIEDDYASTCLLSLPNELLEMIAFNLPGYSHMLNFALSNKYLQSITEAAMCKKLVVSKKGIKGFLEALSRHLPLGEKVISADLGDFSCMGRLQCACPTADLEKDMVVFLTHVIASRTNHTVDWFQLRRSGQGSGPMWTAKEAFFLDALFSLCPNLKSLTVELPQAMPFDGAGPPVALSNAPVPLPSPNLELPCSPPLQGAALYLAQRNLEVLTIAEDQRWKGPQKHEMLTNSNVTWRALGKHTITLAGFRKLKKLDVPLAALGNPYSIRFLDPTATPKLVDETDEAGPSDDKKTRQEPPSLPVKVLPSTLESLYLRSCGNSTFVLLLNIAQMPAGTLQLKRIEIFLQTNAKHMILKCQAEDEDKLSYLQILSHLSRNGIRVRFYNGDQDSPINMMAELTSLYFLSPWESILISTMTIQFSEVNLRSSQHRRQSPDASRLFFKHASTHFDLFNSPTFTPHAWNNIGFFHGNLNTKLRHRKASRHRINEHGKLCPRDPPIQAHLRLLGKRNLVPHLRPLFGPWF